MDLSRMIPLGMCLGGGGEAGWGGVRVKGEERIWSVSVYIL